MNTSSWPAYRSRKIVRAAKIELVMRDAAGNAALLMVRPDPNGALVPFTPTVTAMLEQAEVGGYAVVYEPDAKHPTGYQSVSPAQAFLDGYVPMVLGRGAD